MIAVFITLLPALLLAGTVNLPRTGQTKSYAPWDDGHIQAGVAWPEPRFTDNGNGAITDNLTGLMWLKDTNCIKTKYPGFDKDAIAGDGRVTWPQALDFVAGINIGTYSDCGAGYTDWRLPNVNELESLVNAGQANQVTWLNSWGFTNVQTYFYWSSTTYARSIVFAWVIGMEGGVVRVDGNKNNDYFIWPVRLGRPFDNSLIPVAPVWKTGQTTSYASGDDGAIQAGVPRPAPRFTDSGDGTVTDNLTGLMWLKDANCFGEKEWQPAFNAIADFITNPGKYNCKGHTASYTDWRLPNVNELESLVNTGQADPAAWLMSQGFANVQARWYWSSSTLAGDTVRAWLVDMWGGYVDASHKGNGSYVWPVRAGSVSIIIIPTTTTTAIPSAPPSVNLTMPKTKLVPGDSLILDLEMKSGGSTGKVDFFFYLVKINLPDSFSLFLSQELTFVKDRTPVVSNFKPLDFKARILGPNLDSLHSILGEFIVPSGIETGAFKWIAEIRGASGGSSHAEFIVFDPGLQTGITSIESETGIFKIAFDSQQWLYIKKRGLHAGSFELTFTSLKEPIW